MGTCCHQICEDCLLDANVDPQDYLGRWMDFYSDRTECWRDPSEVREDSQLIRSVEVTQDMIDAVVSGLNFVRQIHTLKGGMLEAEQRVPIGHITGEEGAGGTSDVVILGDGWLWGGDFKFGRHKVTAYDVIEPAGQDLITGEMAAEVVRANLQIALYLLGAAEKYKLLGPFHTVTMCVIQPFLNHVSEYTCTFKELEALAWWLMNKAEETRTNPKFVPSAENCHFCKANGNCAAQDRFVLENALLGFEDVATAKVRPIDELRLGSKYALIPLLQGWIKAVDARVREKMLAGEPVRRDDGLRYKFVDGKKGDREWVEAAEAEAQMKVMRLKDEQMYTKKLISPTMAEKLAKTPRVKKGEEPKAPVIGKTQWNRLSAMVRQPDGAPVIVLETDPRPERASRTDGFEDVPSENNSDLF